MMQRTLWEEGRWPAGLVLCGLVPPVAVVAAAELWARGELAGVFDAALVLSSLAAALLVRPGEFVRIALAGFIIFWILAVVIAATYPAGLGAATDSYAQALIIGFTRHIVAIAIGTTLTLGVLGVRRWVLSFEQPHSNRDVSPAP